MSDNSCRLKNGTRLYTVMYPIWGLVFLPAVWKVILPVSFVLNSAVILIMLSRFARERGDTGYKPWGDWLRTVFLSWIFNFVSYLIAGGFLMFWGAGPTLLLGDTTKFTAWWGAKIAEPMMDNPFESIFSVLFMLLAIGLAAMLVYFFNKHVSLRLTKSLDLPEIRKTALVLSLVTAPWFMLIPTAWFM